MVLPSSTVLFYKTYTMLNYIKYGISQKWDGVPLPRTISTCAAEPIHLRLRNVWRVKLHDVSHGFSMFFICNYGDETDDSCMFSRIFSSWFIQIWELFQRLGPPWTHWGAGNHLFLGHAGKIYSKPSNHTLIQNPKPSLLIWPSTTQKEMVIYDIAFQCW